VEANHKILIELLSAALTGGGFKIDDCLEKHKMGYVDWNAVYHEAVAHGVHTLIYPVVKEVEPEKAPGLDTLEKWHIEAMACGIKSCMDELRTGEVCRAFGEAGIAAILLKGMAIKNCYPDPELRTMGDVDILVHEEDMEKASEVLLLMGYKIIDSTNTRHVEFAGRNTVPIELHRLLSDYEFIKNNELFHQELWEDLLEISLGNSKANILSWDMQILHMCIHMATHLIYKGFGLRQLCDFVVVYQAKKAVIDWKGVLRKSEEYGIKQFLLAVFQVCSLLFRIDVPEALKGDDMTRCKQLDSFVKDILKGGVFGQYDMDRAAVNAVIRNTGKKEKCYKNRVVNAFLLLFPSRAKLSQRPYYSYLKAHPYLLPLAWLQRISYGFLRRDFDFKTKKEIFLDGDLAQTARERNELLLWLNLK
jgi:hypothetical protein